MCYIGFDSFLLLFLFRCVDLSGSVVFCGGVLWWCSVVVFCGAVVCCGGVLWWCSVGVWISVAVRGSEVCGSVVWSLCVYLAWCCVLS